MRKLIGLSVWWLFLVVATLIVETVFGGVPLWVMILIAVLLGAVAIPLMFGREIKEWRSRKPSPFSLPELPEDKVLILDDREAVRCNPGNGWRAARLIMQCSTVNEVDAIFADFQSTPNKTSSADVFAARALKKNHLLNIDHQDEDWWWDFYEEINRSGIDERRAVEIFLEFEKEFPMNKDQAGDG